MAAYNTTSTAEDTGAEISCEFCPGAHAESMDCPVVKEFMADFHEQQNLIFDELEKEDKIEFHRTHTQVEQIWKKYDDEREEKFLAEKKLFKAKERYLLESMKLYALLRRTIRKDEIKPMEADEEEETQACIFCSSFHCSRDCPIFLKKKEELLLIRDEKIGKWEEEMTTELRVLVDDKRETWQGFKTKYSDKFRIMYVSLREEEKRIIKHLTLASTAHALLLDTPESSEQLTN